jgi:hypothetical protein
LARIAAELPAVEVWAEVRPGDWCDPALRAALRQRSGYFDPDPRLAPERFPLFRRYFLFHGKLPKALGSLEVFCYLHHYLRSDPDRGPHDHPWGWAVALPLAGASGASSQNGREDSLAPIGYVEDRMIGFGPDGPTTVRIERVPGVAYGLTGGDFHRVLIEPGATSWSLFLHGPKAKVWGFLRPLEDPHMAGAFRYVLGSGPASGDLDAEWWLRAKSGAALAEVAP